MKAISMKNITKRFGEVIANNQVNLDVEKGEIHCLLGENGAGKTTLMKILFGLYSSDKGEVYINEEMVDIKGPNDALKYNLGMIHQHFMLANRLTVVENIIAGKEIKNRVFIDLNKSAKMIKELSQKYGLNIKPLKLIEDISVGARQRVEILKVLYRDADILIFDEPTAVLTPQETKELFKIMNNLKEAGKTIIFITHKLKETMAISDRITVLRDGKSIGTVKTSETNPNELARMMVGREVILDINKSSYNPSNTIFEFNDVNYKNKNVKINNMSFSVKKGEILGIAGVEGNGQLELEKLLVGLKSVDKGQIIFKDQEITNMKITERRNNGIAYIPSDRNKFGLINSFSVYDNILLGSEWQEPFANKGLLDYSNIKNYSNELIEEYDIRCPSCEELSDCLSGGNQQKIIIARELSRDPDLIIACQPTRGVDVGAIEYIHKTLLKLRDEGKAVILISVELDELRALSDNITVLYEGKLVSYGPTQDYTDEELGLLMAGHREDEI